ncbi:MAG: hypothetical protein KDD65_10115 [Bacteroidetes bacterium]|nr:hypothetical protein [Bacteroidota bacterium]
MQQTEFVDQFLTSALLKKYADDAFADRERRGVRLPFRHFDHSYFCKMAEPKDATSGREQAQSPFSR